MASTKTTSQRTEESFTIPASFDPVLSMRQVLDMLGGMSDVTHWRMRRDGKFPEPIRLSPNRVGWRLSVVNAWLQQRQAVTPSMPEVQQPTDRAGTTTTTIAKTTMKTSKRVNGTKRRRRQAARS